MMMKFFVLLLILVSCITVNSYSNGISSSIRNSRILLNAKSKKREGGGGFGKTKENENVSISTTTSSSTSSSTTTTKLMEFQADGDSSSTTTTTASTIDSREKSDIAKSLKQESPEELEKKILSTKMFKDQRTKSMTDLDDKIRRLKEEEDLIASDPSVGAVPEIIANRMITRIAGFFGIPVFGGLAIFVGAFFYSKKTDSIIPPYIIAYATQLPFLLGLIGISYAILSSSWDEDRDGSLLGFDELKLNIKRIQEGFGRVQDTAKLKEEIEKDIAKLGKKK
jgi:hypothetical protein